MQATGLFRQLSVRKLFGFKSAWRADPNQPRRLPTFSVRYQYQTLWGSSV